MNPWVVGGLMVIVVFACIVAGVIAYPMLPDLVVSHWNAVGEANGVMGRFWGVFMMPLIMTALVGVWALLPVIDPITPGFKGFRHIYDFSFFLIIAFFAYVYALILGVNLGLEFSVFKMSMPAYAILTFVIGALMPRFKRNWFFGIRTPWTIPSDDIWNKTHRLGSWLFMIAGLFIFAGTFVSPEVALWFMLVPLLSSVLICVVYSYMLFRAGGGSSQDNNQAQHNSPHTPHTPHTPHPSPLLH